MQMTWSAHNPTTIKIVFMAFMYPELSTPTAITQHQKPVPTAHQQISNHFPCKPMRLLKSTDGNDHDNDCMILPSWVVMIMMTMIISCLGMMMILQSWVVLIPS